MVNILENQNVLFAKEMLAAYDRVGNKQKEIAARAKIVPKQIQTVMADMKKIANGESHVFKKGIDSVRAVAEALDLNILIPETLLGISPEEQKIKDFLNYVRELIPGDSIDEKGENIAEYTGLSLSTAKLMLSSPFSAVSQSTYLNYCKEYLGIERTKIPEIVLNKWKQVKDSLGSIDAIVLQALHDEIDKLRQENKRKDTIIANNQEDYRLLLKRCEDGNRENEYLRKQLANKRGVYVIGK